MFSKTTQIFLVKATLVLLACGSLMLAACAPIIKSFTPERGDVGTDVDNRAYFCHHRTWYWIQ